MGDKWPLPEGVLAERRPALAAWLDLLATWNARIDLTAARSPGELVDLMLEDAVLLAARVPFGASVVDVGTGAGAPGLGLALLRPDLRVRLVEPLNKRVAFLRTVVGTTAASNVTLERARGEDVAARGEAFDVATARATLPPDAWLALGLRLVKKGGSVWVFLAKEDAPASDRAKLEEEVAYTWRATGAARRAVRYSRSGDGV
jgi:16S rRNA (guanine527-N7)-methyltransferase